MTCEIAVMNREAVALAADSTSSIVHGRKVFTSAEKLFSLSHRKTVGIMVYGDADLLEVPWETIIKRYRDKLGSHTFQTLGDYGKNLIGFLESNEHDLLPDAAQERYFIHTVRVCLETIVEDVDKRVHSIIESKGRVTHQQIQHVTSEVIERYLNELNKVDTFPMIPEDYNIKLLNKYEQRINELKNEVLEELPITDATEQQLKDIAISLFSRDIHSIKSSELEYFSEYEPTRLSGIVIAGFGDFDTFPSIVTYEIEGMLLNHLIYVHSEDKSKTIDLDKLPAEIIPFAQTDMVEQFLYGVDQNYDLDIMSASCNKFKKACQETIDGDRKLAAQDKQRLKNKLRKRLASAEKGCTDESARFQVNRHWWPIMRVLSALPKSELATMAETLVNLTSFKQRVSFGRETVGGPVDVAIISRGDGFVWVKRKRYFPADLNPELVD